MKLLITGFGIALSFGVSSASTSVPAENENYSKGHSTREEAINATINPQRLTEDNDAVLRMARDNDDLLQQEFGDAFAGTWIEFDEGHNAYQVIGLTRPIASRNLKKINSRIKFAYVKYNLETLYKVRDNIQDRYLTNNKNPYPITSTSIDLEHNLIIVRGLKENLEKVKNLLTIDGYDLDLIRIDAGGTLTPHLNLYGGQGVVVQNDLHRSTCTSGFNAIVSERYGVSITAAHCSAHLPDKAKSAYFNNGSNERPLRGMYIGDFLADELSNGGLMDAILFGNVNDAHKQLPAIYAGVTTLQILGGSNVPRQGDTICAQGHASSWRCGTVASPSIRHVWPQSGLAANMVEVKNMCGSPGDSGGPVVTLGAAYAVAIYTGGLGGNSCGPVIGGTEQIALIQPLMPYLNKHKNIKLMTK